ncbi:MAG: homocysteine S-methyltransferase family protein [Lachnospiraceae bacterium]|nr:homocysteine S-methyltransferase family protein [Lachnospiraceae bacterium]
MTVLEALKERVLISDGGMGSLLQAAGLAAGELPETWNIRHPEIIKQIHLDYLHAGSDLVTTNTFGANALKYNKLAEYDLPEIVRAAVANAREAVSEAGHGYVALDLGPTGRLLKPMGDLAFEDCVALYAEVVRLGAEAGADLILIETMSDMYELKAAVLAAKENADLPIFATVVFDQRGKMLTGGTPEAVTATLEGLGADAIGVNCGLGPEQLRPYIERMLQRASIPIFVQPNAGLPRTEGKRTVYDIGPEDFAGMMEGILDLGVSAVGGCCGTTPAHIEALARVAKGRKAPVIVPKTETTATSYAVAHDINDDPTLIGEHINPTGKKRFQQALREHDLDYIMSIGIMQQNEGVHALDVNVGLPDIDEKELLPEIVAELQSIIELPLQIDTTDPQAMERAMRIYNGKPLVNSVNGKQVVMDAIFPLVKKYGGVVIALTIDEDGIPSTVEGRLAIAEKIYREAEKYGIGKKDIIVDPLCLTISSEQNGAMVTLETIRRIKTDFGGRTMAAIANISFGLPCRGVVNGAFFTMALQNGVSAAIINVKKPEMMDAYRAFRALNCLDDHCTDYVTHYAPVQQAMNEKAAAGKAQAGNAAAGSTAAGKTAAPGADNAAAAAQQGAASGKEALMETLRSHVERGLKKQAAEAAGALLSEADALEIINSCMVPALDAVGKKFEKGVLFLPQLLMSAEAAQAAFAVIKEKMAEDGQVGTKLGTVILATVKGDIHDIGKNIVKVLLENYSFEVLDLGRDVAPEKIVEETKKHDIRLVGLSALMTTTVPAMEETIVQLRKECPDTKIMVGGAVMTKDYAEKIGADYYGRDAMASVNYAQEIFG